MRILLPILLLLVLATGCNRELNYDRPGPEYFPTWAGLQRTYQVIDTSFSSTPAPNPYGLAYVLDPHYRLEVTGTEETDLMGRPLSRMELWRTPDTAAANRNNFAFDELWTLHRNDEWAERIEGNIRYLVLRIPIRPTLTWDGNAYNTRGSGPDQQNYRYLTTDSTVTLGGQTYQHCVVVQQRKSKTLLYDVDTYEIYAPNVGLIKRYDRNIIYDDNDPDNLTTDSYIRIQTIVNHN